ncbi:PDDEXK nuclease domain-containing protein [Methanoplanus endosymbiosus]|uniref:PDDEXK nuclease domain-containing protein n=1 Tax=Methanoplanus endosymbiosus TaxID=33865 RepID=A0A9E7PKP2_9EURY|nr:PDDEXK nuclease domain-containing protein [Methanoplanus endosymbiosus]UUX91928.1 PDDEXK nuclease domain-containing protein [Methanoplanus endosymbiosus]
MTSEDNLNSDSDYCSLQSDDIYQNVRRSVITAQKQVYTAVNSAMVQAYWEIGEQISLACGENFRAEYGKNLLKFLSEKLTEEFGRGFDITNLRKMRQFYIVFPIRDALRLELSWTHYRHLMRISDTNARNFYMDECVKSNWSSRQLERQITTFFYERLLASQDKEGLVKEVESTEPKPEYEQIIKDPYVLEFLNLEANPKFYERDLEEALITNLQNFLLELGRGFSFVSRQKRISFDGRNFYIDLVFYNYILKCFVLIDLKLGDLTHQDLGQMQMYVNYYTREMKNEGDNPPVGIVLCADKSDAVVKYTLPEDNSQIFASKYMQYIPTEEEFKRELNLDGFRKINDDDPEDNGDEV